MRFNETVVNDAGAIKTIQELMQAQIALRTGSTAQQIADEISRCYGATPYRGWLRPVDGDVYVLDAYKGVHNGRVSNFDGVTLVAGDFTGDPGATIWSPGQVMDLTSLTLGSLVIYTVAETKIALDGLICE